MTAPVLSVARAWHAALAVEHHAALADALHRFAATQRFYRRRAEPGAASIADCFLAPDGSCALVVVRIGSAGDETDYTLPVRFALGEPDAGVVAELSIRGDDGGLTVGALLDAATDAALGRFLVGLLARAGEVTGTRGRLRASALPALAEQLGGEPSILPLRVEQSHSMLRVGERAVAKLLRALDPGDDTELEVGRFLAGSTPRAPVPALLGWIRYETAESSSTLVVASEHVENDGTAFELFRRELGGALAVGSGMPAVLSAAVTALAACTAALHRALASSSTDPAFAPEPFDAAYGAGVAVNARMQIAELEQALRADEGAEARRCLELITAARPRLDSRLGALPGMPGLVRIRCHGDYHLGQVLSTGGDFVVVDLGGEPLRPPGARREKHCPLRDVAGLFRSFDYALETASRDLVSGGVTPTPGTLARFRGELESSFLAAYLAATRGASFVPAERTDVEHLLAFHVLEKCLYELAYELAQRPAWLSVPRAALERLSR